MKRMRACMAKAPMRLRKSSILSLRTCTKPAVSAAFACLRTWLDLVQLGQAALFYEFSLERHVPADHLLRPIARFVEVGELRRERASSTAVSVVLPPPARRRCTEPWPVPKERSLAPRVRDSTAAFRS